MIHITSNTIYSVLSNLSPHTIRSINKYYTTESLFSLHWTCTQLTRLYSNIVPRLTCSYGCICSFLVYILKENSTLTIDRHIPGWWVLRVIVNKCGIFHLVMRFTEIKFKYFKSKVNVQRANISMCVDFVFFVCCRQQLIIVPCFRCYCSCLLPLSL